MSTGDGRFDDGPAGPMRVADFDALDEPDEPAPQMRVASFDPDDQDAADGVGAGDVGLPGVGDGPEVGSPDASGPGRDTDTVDGADAPDEDPAADDPTTAAPTAGHRTVDLDSGPDAGEPPRLRVVSFDDLPAATGSDGAPRRALLDGTAPADRRETGARRRRDGAGRPDRRGRSRRERDGVADAGTARGGAADVRAARGGRAAPRADAGPSQDDESRAKEICLRLLTDRARTVKELRDALVRKEIPEDVADQVLERFDEVGLVDDEAFAGQWVRSRHRHRGLGKRAIAQELRRKGVAREIADEALTEIDAESEEARARELVEKKIRTVKVGTREERASASRRLVGMLARKGYGAGVAYSVVREAIAARGAEEDEMGEEPPED